MSSEIADLPNVFASPFQVPTLDALTPKVVSTHPPRFLLLYGSLRERSFSRLLTLGSLKDEAKNSPHPL